MQVQRGLQVNWLVVVNNIPAGMVAVEICFPENAALFYANLSAPQGGTISAGQKVRNV
jgi:hypothetical protein